ncbi:short-chain dehydrogenase/ reductase-like protein [Lepidopterella palustris CBS 459.81]|uniref:Short-chain dehydrogenase/ reductase-like protein n=1 Tax=Lepidopterella palustris CBS 459.81 TaxID=1314670 RepID=A0A8E2JCS4_9PEZI|nr:short-chain dehydrogenase/ reductase-like protein [Lepidopterella palustris CBS 459.81]
MVFNYKKILVIGATSGIGKGYTEKFIEDGIKVIVAGRRKERLDALVETYGKDKVEAVQLDITLLNQIPKFVLDTTSAHPDLDCIFINSGIQRAFDFSKPETVDLSILDEEVMTNYTAYIHLTLAFIPHLQKQENQTSLIYTSSGLALVPVARCLNYCATKAALHSFILCLREQMRDGPGNIKVIEIFPPAVQTELHDERHQPDIKNGRAIGMPLDEFIEESWEGLVRGEEQIAVGMAATAFNGFEALKQATFHKMNDMIKGIERRNE